ncbi:MAG: hypothetical protein HY683_08320 [Chloroflexi bacterium]|nr:hypothetical protein [Chloroflexota bacterium]
MVTVPGFLLRRLYVKGSLSNTEDGFEFQLKNQLGSGYAKKLLPLSADGEVLAPEHSFFVIDDQRTSFVEVSEERPFTLALNRSITIRARGKRLAPGAHKIGMSFVVQGLGTLGFDFTDVVNEA